MYGELKIDEMKRGMMVQILPPLKHPSSDVKKK